MSVCQNTVGVPDWETKSNGVQVDAAVTFSPLGESGRRWSLPPTCEFVSRLVTMEMCYLEERVSP